MTPILSSSKTTNVYFLAVSVCQESGGSSSESSNSGPLTSWTQDMCWGRCSHFKAQLSSHPHGCWQDSILHKLLDSWPRFLTGCWLEMSLGSWLHGPLHMAAPNMAAGFPQSQRQSKKGRHKRRQSFPNVISE